MSTVGDLITDALQDIGAVAIDEAPTTSEMNAAFRKLNNMIDTWSTESLMVYNITENVFPLTSGQQVYTLGTGGDFNIPRPPKIDLVYARDGDGNDYNMINTSSPDQYASIISKYTTSSIPQLLYDDGGYPLKNITLWPVPSDPQYSLVLWVWGVIAAFGAINDTIVLPPGYYLALEYNLAVLLAPSFGRKASEDLTSLALSSKAQVKRINTDVKMMGYDTTLIGAPAVFNWYTGNIS